MLVVILTMLIAAPWAMLKETALKIKSVKT
jgi:hypothetical protein